MLCSGLYQLYLVWVGLRREKFSKLVYVLGQSNIREISSVEQHVARRHLEVVLYQTVGVYTYKEKTPESSLEII